MSCSQDNGHGIAADKLPYIFDRFYRIDSERKKDYVCTGLGLAIAKELIEAHCGKITVTSIEQEGTCFTIMLPVLHENGDEMYSMKHILIIEDDIDIAELERDYLQLNGYTCRNRSRWTTRFEKSHDRHV